MSTIGDMIEEVKGDKLKVIFNQSFHHKVYIYYFTKKVKKRKREKGRKEWNAIMWNFKTIFS